MSYVCVYYSFKYLQFINRTPRQYVVTINSIIFDVWQLFKSYKGFNFTHIFQFCLYEMYFSREENRTYFNSLLALNM